MSLLLEALKKAEKAKEDAQRRARDGDGTGELRLADEAAPAAEAKHIVTRPELPEITSPHEILSEDLRAEAPSSPEREFPPQNARAAAASRPGSRGGAEPLAAQRATARQVFEAKVREPNPRLPFLITVGALSTFAVGIVVYFWIQLRPPAPLVNASPAKPTGEVQATVALPAPAALLQPAASAQPVIQGLPTGKPAVQAAKPPPGNVAAAPARAATPAIPRDPPATRIRPAALGAAPRVPESQVIAARRAPAQIHPRVEAGYAAYQAGRMDDARGDYQQALRDEPANRDALLGLAAVDMRTGRYEAADALYLRLLQADPRDAHAHAGLMALRSRQLDPVAAESRLKTLLASDPESGVLHFALGNQYAQQGRWAEARQAYLRAAASDPDNPDYAYNLAVSLEHLRLSAPALENYRRALALGLKRNASFDPAEVQSRAQVLAR